MPTPIKAAAQSGVAVGTSSVSLIVANPRRKYLSVSNSGTAGIWLGFGQDAVVGVGIYVPPNGGFFQTSDGDNLWQGSVTAIAASGTNQAGIVEGY
jgi:hypothetical protein